MQHSPRPGSKGIFAPPSETKHIMQDTKSESDRIVGFGLSQSQRRDTADGRKSRERLVLQCPAPDTELVRGRSYRIGFSCQLLGSGLDTRGSGWFLRFEFMQFELLS